MSKEKVKKESKEEVKVVPIRMPTSLVDAIDSLVDCDQYASRSHFVRFAAQYLITKLKETKGGE